MKQFDIQIRTLGPLLIGGQSAPCRGGDKGTARDLDGRPLIPASALRGALRMTLERLLRGRDGADAACGANPRESTAPKPPCSCPTCRLFGQEGHGIGALRLEDAVLADDHQAAVSVRPQVAVSRRSGAAVEGHLAFLEPATGAHADGLLFTARAHLAAQGPQYDRAALERDAENLRAACAALSALGGGKARGFGWVECSLVESDSPSKPSVPTGVRGARSDALTLTFEARAPLHFGQGRPLGSFLPTRSWAPGSTVRGAVAFALLERGLCNPDDERFQTLVTPSAEGPSFGAARARGDRASATRRKCRPYDHVFDDLLGELVRRAAGDRGIALALRPGGSCPEPGCTATKIQPWSWVKSAPRLDRRVRTRTAINRQTGTSMDQKLYSIEVIEARTATAPGGNGQPLVLEAEIRGLDPGSSELLALLEGCEIWLGGRRSRGMGRCLGACTA